MSGIKSTSSGAPPQPVDTASGGSTTQQQVAPVAPSSPSGGQSGPAIPQASSVSQLSEGAIIAAIVTARATGGDTMLHAEIGNFRMTASGQLPVGSHVVLEVEAFDDVIIAKIISLNGEKLASPPSVTLLPTVSASQLKPEGYGNTGKMPSGDIKTGLQNLTTTLGNSVKDLPIPGQNSSTTNSTSPPNISSSGGKVPTYGNTSVPIPSVGPQGSAPIKGQTQISGAAAYAHTNAPGAKIIGQFQATGQSVEGMPGSTKLSDNPLERHPVLVKATIQRPPLNHIIDLPSGAKEVAAGSKITLIATPSTGSENRVAVQGPIAFGTVIGVSGPSRSTMGGVASQVHVQTEVFGTVSYAVARPPQIGSHVTFQMIDELQQFPISSVLLPSGSFKTPHLPIMTEWENLRNSLNVVLAQNPTAGLTILNKLIPSPNNQLSASLLFFLSAINGGSMDKWLGQDFRQALENAGQTQLFKNLEDDFATLTRITTETGGQDWKALAFPFFDGNALRQIKMFYRQRNHSPQEEDEESTRFVIELDLSKSGPVQLDGLFNKTRFDLVFRYQRPIKEVLKQHIMTIFNDNIEITGVQGRVIFQQTTPFPVHPTEEWENTGPDSLNA